MGGLSKLAVQRPITFLMTSLIFIGFGIYGVTQLRLNLYPDVSFPTITIFTGYEGVAPEDIEALVTRPIEEQVGSISGIRRVRSLSSQGASVVKLNFNWGTDLYQYALIKTALLDTSSIEVPNSYKDRLIKNRNVVIKSEYWKITTNGLEEAERIKEEINSGDLPISYDAFQMYDYQTIDQSDNDFNLIRKALVNTPVIGYSETDGWMVINVVQRDLTEVKDETSTADIETKYRVFTTINSEIESLRKEATIKVDTLLFNDIYEVWKIRKEEE